MKRIILLVSTVMVMTALVLASALPALAARPSFTASCIFPQFGTAILTTDPQELNAFIRNCEASGGTATRGPVTPTPGPPTQ